MIEARHLTGLEIALMDYFADGMKKPIRQVLDFIRENQDDQEISKTNVVMTITRLRRKLPKGREIHCVSEGKRKYYVMCRTLSNP